MAVKKPLPAKSPMDLASRGLIYNRLQVPAKLVQNTKGNMDLLELYSKGALRFEGTGKICRECTSFYFDPKTRYGGRCKSRGFKETHPDTPADDRPKGWTHPVEGISFPFWPSCPYYVEKVRLSRR